MNAPMSIKGRPYNGRLNVTNAEASTNILAGQPVFFPLNLTGDGSSVVLPGTSATNLTAHAGIAAPTKAAGAAPGEQFDVITMGFCNYTRLVRGTRAATTDAWPTFPAVGMGDILQVVTAGNGLAFSATANNAGTGRPPFICAGLATATATGGLTAASTVTVASNAYSAFSGQTAYTIAIRSWLNCLG